MFKAIRRSLKGENPYQSWKDESDSLEVANGEEDEQDKETPPAEPKPYKEECFYLGSQEMFGAEIQGYGCLVKPIEHIWSLTQEKKPKRKGSQTAKSPSANPRTSSRSSSTGSTPSGDEFDLGDVKLVEIEVESCIVKVRDSNTREILIDFPLTHVATCGVHKHLPQAFAFVAVEYPNASPFCHVFKGHDKASTAELARQFNECFIYNIKVLRMKHRDPTLTEPTS